MGEATEFDFKCSTEAEVYEKPLLAEGIAIEAKISGHIKSITSIKSGLWGKREPLDEAFSIYLQEVDGMADYRSRVRVYQQYGSSVYSVANPNTLMVLSDVVEQIEKKLVIYSDLINRKENEISSSKIALTNIVLSVAAIIVALIAIA